MNKVLVILNPQLDYLTAGMYPVENGEAILKKINKLTGNYDQLIITQDWYHPENEIFAGNHLWRRPGQLIQVNGRDTLLWEMHCIRDSFGSLISPLIEPKNAIVIQCNLDSKKASTSLFDHARSEDGEDFESLIKRMDIEEIHICGFTKEAFINNTLSVLGEQNIGQKMLEDLIRYIIIK